MLAKLDPGELRMPTDMVLCAINKWPTNKFVDLESRLCVFKLSKNKMPRQADPNLGTTWASLPRNDAKN